MSECGAVIVSYTSPIIDGYAETVKILLVFCPCELWLEMEIHISILRSYGLFENFI